MPTEIFSVEIPESLSQLEGLNPDDQHVLSTLLPLFRLWSKHVGGLFSQGPARHFASPGAYSDWLDQMVAALRNQAEPDLRNKINLDSPYLVLDLEALLSLAMMTHSLIQVYQQLVCAPDSAAEQRRDSTLQCLKVHANELGVSLGLTMKHQTVRGGTRRFFAGHVCNLRRQYRIRLSVCPFFEDVETEESFVATDNQLAFMTVFATTYAPVFSMGMPQRSFDITALTKAVAPAFMRSCFEELPGIYNRLIAEPRLAMGLPSSVVGATRIQSMQKRMLSPTQQMLVETAQKFSAFLSDSLMDPIGFDHFLYLAHTAHNLLQHFEKSIKAERMLPIQMLLMLYQAQVKLKATMVSLIQVAEDVMEHVRYEGHQHWALVYNSSWIHDALHTEPGIMVTSESETVVLPVGLRNFFARLLHTYGDVSSVSYDMPSVLILTVQPLRELHRELLEPGATMAATRTLRSTLDTSDVSVHQPVQDIFPSVEAEPLPLPFISDADQAQFFSALDGLREPDGIDRYGDSGDLGALVLNESMLWPTKPLPDMAGRVRDLTNDYAAGSRTLFCCCLLGQDRGIYNTPESLNASSIRTMTDKLEELNDDVDCYFSEYEQTFENYRRYVDFVPGGRSEVKQVVGALAVVTAAAVVAVTTLTLLVTAPPLFAIIAAAAAASVFAGGMAATGAGLYFLGRRRSGLSKAMAEFHDEARNHMDDRSRIPTLTHEAL